MFLCPELAKGGQLNVKCSRTYSNQGWPAPREQLVGVDASLLG